MVRQSLDKPTIITLIFAVAIQIQASLFAEGDYLGLRVNLADILLPFIGIFILISLFMQKSYWPKWNISYMWLWLASLAIIMTISLFRGIEVNGYISNWALINKYVGFFILVFYFLLGSWIANNTRNYRKTVEYLALSLTAFFNLVIIFSFIFTLANKHLGFEIFLITDPWEGFMGNRNAFMVIAVLAMVCLVFMYQPHSIKGRAEHYIFGLFVFLIPLFFVGNASRTGWLIISVLFIILMIKEREFVIKRAVPLLLLGAGLAIIGVTLLNVGSYQVKDQYSNLTKLVDLQVQGQDQEMYIGDQKRFIALEDGFDLYEKTGSSVLGAGLGTYKPFQIQKRGEFIDVIDFTAFWLFVETGPLGLLVFVSFFFVCLWSTLKRENQNNQNAEILKATAAFLICFAAMSLLHELLYTRILWFVLGLALASNQNTYSSSTRLETRSNSS